MPDIDNLCLFAHMFHFSRNSTKTDVQRAFATTELYFILLKRYTVIKVSQSTEKTEIIDDKQFPKHTTLLSNHV